MKNLILICMFLALPDSLIQVKIDTADVQRTIKRTEGLNKSMKSLDSKLDSLMFLFKPDTINE